MWITVFLTRFQAKGVKVIHIPEKGYQHWTNGMFFEKICTDFLVELYARFVHGLPNEFISVPYPLNTACFTL